MKSENLSGPGTSNVVCQRPNQGRRYLEQNTLHIPILAKKQNTPQKICPKTYDLDPKRSVPTFDADGPGVSQKDSLRTSGFLLKSDMPKYCKSTQTNIERHGQKTYGSSCCLEHRASTATVQNMPNETLEDWFWWLAQGSVQTLNLPSLFHPSKPKGGARGCPKKGQYGCAQKCSIRTGKRIGNTGFNSCRNPEQKMKPEFQWNALQLSKEPKKQPFAATSGGYRTKRRGLHLRSLR